MKKSRYFKKTKPKEEPFFDIIDAAVLRNYSVLKGRLAEALAHGLFHNLNFEVIRMGIEAQSPRLAQWLSKNTVDIQKELEPYRYSPDFLVFRNQKPFVIETKYRSNGEIVSSECDKYKDENLYFLFLDKQNFYCIKNNELKNTRKKVINFKKDCALLSEHQDFSFSKKDKITISTYSVFIEEFMNLEELYSIKNRMIKKRPLHKSILQSGFMLLETFNAKAMLK